MFSPTSGLGPASTVSLTADSEKGGVSAGQVVNGASGGVGATIAARPPGPEGAPSDAGAGPLRPPHARGSHAQPVV